MSVETSATYPKLENNLFSFLLSEWINSNIDSYVVCWVSNTFDVLFSVSAHEVWFENKSYSNRPKSPVLWVYTLSSCEVPDIKVSPDKIYTEGIKSWNDTQICNSG